MTEETGRGARDWQLEHYARVGKEYGDKHFTRADSEYTNWVLGQIAGVKPDARAIAEVGAGTCVFASLLGSRMGLELPVVCYEPVAELLEAAADFANVRAVHGGAAEFARDASDNAFDLVYTKDTAHHFAVDSLTGVHRGLCAKLKPGGRYLMVVRTPPDPALVPVGRDAGRRWPDLYTSLGDLLAAMRKVPDWREVAVTRWEKAVPTSAREWIDGVRGRDTWSVFSALGPDEIAATVDELEARFDGGAAFDFLHQYDVAVFEKPGRRRRPTTATSAPAGGTRGLRRVRGPDCESGVEDTGVGTGATR